MLVVIVANSPMLGSNVSAAMERLAMRLTMISTVSMLVNPLLSVTRKAATFSLTS